MNKALQGILQGPNPPINVTGPKDMEMSVLEKQILEQFHPQLLQQSCVNDLSLLPFISTQMHDFPSLNMGSGLNEILTRPIKPDPGLENSWVNYRMPESGVTVDSVDHANNYKKRKAETSPTPKEDKKSKRSKEEELKITEQNSKNKENKKKREDTSFTSMDDTKSVEAPKLDYIHVRARRGQATDSHSLAERVRREKISERMKYLQDLVPGCSKITGKAGMLDEIINYVQSLQRQVEFLSMKLATVNPRLGLDIDDLITSEVFSDCSTSMPAMEICQEITNPDYLQYNPIQHMDPVCGSKVIVNPIDNVSMPETFIDPSYFSQMSGSLPWHADLQNIYSMEFQQGRSTSFPLQTFTGTMEGSNLKMEM